MCESKRYTNVFRWENIPVRTHPKKLLDTRNTSEFNSHPEQLIQFSYLIINDERQQRHLKEHFWSRRAHLSQSESVLLSYRSAMSSATGSTENKKERKQSNLKCTYEHFYLLFAD